MLQPPKACSSPVWMLTSFHAQLGWGCVVVVWFATPKAEAVVREVPCGRQSADVCSGPLPRVRCAGKKGAGRTLCGGNIAERGREGELRTPRLPKERALASLDAGCAAIQTPLLVGPDTVRSVVRNVGFDHFTTESDTPQHDSTTASDDVVSASGVETIHVGHKLNLTACNVPRGTHFTRPNSRVSFVYNALLAWAMHGISLCCIVLDLVTSGLPFTYLTPYCG